MAQDIIDFAASRLGRSRTAANVKTAIGEADQIAEQLQRDLAQAHLAALAGIDASEFIAAAQARIETLGKQMTFAGALAERALLARCAKEA